MANYLYIKILETKEITKNYSDDSTEPFVTGKLNGHEHLHKKSTKIHSGDLWWEQIFRFRIRDQELDWVCIEVREKGDHLVKSDWIGEVLIKCRDYKDGQVHENWFHLGEGNMKRHTRLARGYIHLMIHLVEKGRTPFETSSVEGAQTFEQWMSGAHPYQINYNDPGNTLLDDRDINGPSSSVPRSLVSSSSSNGSDFSDYNDPNKVFELTYDNINVAENSISKNAWKILATEHPTTADITQMKKYNRVNCLHKGNFDKCRGKKYMVCVDGTESSREAFNSTFNLMDKQNDHLFIVTVRERTSPKDYYNEESQAVIAHKLWKAAAGILSQYQEICIASGVDYTTIMPVADDAREMVCALTRKFNIDVLVIGKHKPAEKGPRSKYFRSFQRYCQGHAKCSVMTFGQY